MREVMDAARGIMGVEAETESPRRDWRPLPVGATQMSRPRLSAGEVVALKLYVSGLSTVDVADHMNVRYETAKTYLRRVRDKYAKARRPASSRSDLIRRAAEDGYLR
jgi:DNA-binding CsgD family transcriptional regulator